MKPDQDLQMVNWHQDAPSSGLESAPRLLKGRLLRGCNIHHRTTVFSQAIDPGALSRLRAPEAGADFVAGFVERFGGLESLTPGGCLPEATRLALEEKPGLLLTEALLEAILAVERYVAYTMCRLNAPQFSRVVQREGIVELVWESHAAGTSRAAARTAFAGLSQLLPAGLGGEVDPAEDFEALLDKLRRRSRRRQWSTTTAVLALAAKQGGLPYEPLAGNYLRLGEGTMQQVVSDSALGLSSSPERGDSHVYMCASGRGSDREQLHQLLVVDGNVISALRFDQPAIVGDGVSSIRQLIHRLNDEPRRDDGTLQTIGLDERLRSDLAKSGLGVEDVPQSGEQITLSGVMTFENGAIPLDVTGEVHESIKELAILAAMKHDWRIVRVDLLTEDITRSWRQGRGRVIATSPSPELFLHACLGPSWTQPVGEAVLDLISPAVVAARVPTALVVGERGTGSIARSLDRLLRTSLEGVALATRDQMTIQGRPVDPTSRGRQGGPKALLSDPRTVMVVSAVSPRKIIERGLRMDRASVTALLDREPGSDPEEYRAGVEVSLAATADAVVIGADNPYTEMVLGSFPPARVFLVTRQKGHPMAKRHLAAGGSLVLLASSPHGESVALRRGSKTIASIPVTSLHQGKKKLRGQRLMKALYTAGLAFALDVPAPRVWVRKPIMTLIKGSATKSSASR